MQLTVTDQILRFSFANSHEVGRIVAVDDIGFTMQSLEGNRFSMTWDLLSAGLRVEACERDLKKAA